MDRFSKKKKGKKRVFLALIGLVGGGVMVFGYLFFTPYGDGEKKEFQLTRGLSARQVAQFLKRADIIRSEFLFRLWVSLTSTSTKLQPGRYTIPGEISVADLTEILAPPGTTGQVRITIPEGKTRKEIGEILDRREIVPKKLWLLVEPRDFPEYPFLIGKESLEGFLFPDTYFTRRGMPPREVTDVLLKNFSIKAWPLLKGRTDYYEVLTVASIVEAEVPHPEDRLLVAGILWKRLAANIPLQADSTLNYITGGRNPSLGAEELAIDSPYNTYRTGGLPPTPIGNPGKSAIEAALTPRESVYWYFLSSRDGKTYYAKNFAEHKRNKAKYLR